MHIGFCRSLNWSKKNSINLEPIMQFVFLKTPQIE